MSWRDRCIWALMPGVWGENFTADDSASGTNSRVYSVGQRMAFTDDFGGVPTYTGEFSSVSTKFGHLGSVMAGRFDIPGSDDNQHTKLSRSSTDTGIQFPNSNSLTIAAIFRPEGDGRPGTTGDPRIFTQDEGSGTDDHDLMIGIASSGNEARTRIRIGSTVSTVLTSSSAIADDQVQLVAGRVVPDSATQVRVQVVHIDNEFNLDGETSNTISSVYSPRTSTNISIGATNGADDNGFQGDVLIIAAWDYGLSDDDLLAWFKSPFEIFEPRTVTVPVGTEAGEPPDTEDDLLADDIQSTSELTSPALGQEHDLNATDTESTSELTSPAVGQEHALLADDVQSTSEVTAPDLGESHILDATDVQSTSELTTPTIGQVHAFDATDVESASELTSPSVGQEHALLADDTQSTSEVTNPVLAEGEHNLLADDVESSSELTSPALGQEHALLADDVQSTSELTAPNLAEGEHNLLADDVESSSEITLPSVGQEHALLADDVQSTTEVTNPNLSEAAYQIFAEDIESASELTLPTLAHIYNLTGVGVDSSSEVTSPVIGQEHAILADDIESASTLTMPAINAGSISRVVRLTGNFDFSIDLIGRR